MMKTREVGKLRVSYLTILSEWMAEQEQRAVEIDCTISQVNGSGVSRCKLIHNIEKTDKKNHKEFKIYRK